MVAGGTGIERELQRLEAELKQLEAEYNMFFAGRMARPPWETRSRVEALVKQCDRAHIQNYGDRFRFSSLQARFSAFIDLWDRAMRAREEGRPGPFVTERTARNPPPQGPGDQVLHVASFHDPASELDKLTELYELLAGARLERGEKTIPFPKFAQLVTEHVSKLQQTGSLEVAFRVALKDGKVSFTARAVKA